MDAERLHFGIDMPYAVPRHFQRAYPQCPFVCCVGGSGQLLVRVGNEPAPASLAIHPNAQVFDSVS